MWKVQGQKRPDEGVGVDSLCVKLSERTETPARERRAYLEESTQAIIRVLVMVSPTSARGMRRRRSTSRKTMGDLVRILTAPG